MLYGMVGPCDDCDRIGLSVEQKPEWTPPDLFKSPDLFKKDELVHEDKPTVRYEDEFALTNECKYEGYGDPDIPFEVFEDFTLSHEQRSRMQEQLEVEFAVLEEWTNETYLW